MGPKQLRKIIFFIHTVVNLKIWKFHRSTGPQVPSKGRKRKKFLFMQLSIWRFPSFIGQQVHRSQASKKKKNIFYSYRHQILEILEFHRSTGPQVPRKFEKELYSCSSQFGDFRVS